MLANLYLLEFDQWVVDVLGKDHELRYYRYADDFVFRGKEKQQKVSWSLFVKSSQMIY